MPNRFGYRKECILDKQLLKFVNRETNVVEVQTKILRESIKGRDYVSIQTLVDGEYIPTYSFWHNPQRQITNNPPKHTGGKKPYLMVMIEEVEKLRTTGIKNAEELIGSLVCLGNYIEWNTGRLIHKRKKTSLKYKDLQDIYNCSNKKLNKIIGELKKHQLISSTSEGYFLSSKIIKKGKSKGALDNA